MSTDVDECPWTCRLLCHFGIELCVGITSSCCWCSCSVVPRYMQRVSWCCSFITEATFVVYYCEFFSALIESEGVYQPASVTKHAFFLILFFRWGHFSPLAAYDAATDAFLVMDVEAASGFHSKFWVTCEALHAAMVGTILDGSGRSRGWVKASIVSRFWCQVWCCQFQNMVSCFFLKQVRMLMSSRMQKLNVPLRSSDSNSRIKVQLLSCASTLKK